MNKNNNQMVYVSKNGKVLHLSLNCSFLANSTDFKKLKLKEAKQLSYKFCSRCSFEDQVQEEIEQSTIILDNKNSISSDGDKKKLTYSISSISNNSMKLEFNNSKRGQMSKFLEEWIMKNNNCECIFFPDEPINNRFPKNDTDFEGEDKCSVITKGKVFYFKINVKKMKKTISKSKITLGFAIIENEEEEEDNCVIEKLLYCFVVNEAKATYLVSLDFNNGLFIVNDLKKECILFKKEYIHITNGYQGKKRIIAFVDSNCFPNMTIDSNLP